MLRSVRTPGFIDVCCDNPRRTSSRTSTYAACGRCLACRDSRRRRVVARLRMESQLHAASSFVTLTYSDDALPDHGSLEKAEAQRFLKRFRKRIEPVRFRYFACGEYGTVSKRPHYHVVFFGVPPCRYGRTQNWRKSGDCCSVCDTLRAAWPHGSVQSGLFTDEAAKYIAGYVVHGSALPEVDPREPGFALRSLRPGIGAGFAKAISDHDRKYDLGLDDAPAFLSGGLVLDNYMKRKVRLELLGSELAPDEVRQKWIEDMEVMSVHARCNLGMTPEEYLRSRSAGKRARIEHFERRNKKRLM